MVERESWASTAGVARSMRSNRRRDTSPELALRRILHARGLRYRVDFAPLATMRQRRADIVFTKARLAVFVDGCFWHGCPDHATFPVRNADYWLPKLERNRARDLETDAALADAGWRVIRIWEHEDPTDAADRIEAAYRASP
ncbi:MAG: very short patch repair endonuclease [Microbacteriaceae bacterium]|nr:very short patch repair endonuclease [Microbacteriaceae bacterium]